MMMIMMNKINSRVMRQHIGNTSCIYLNNKSSINIAIHSLFPGLNSNFLAFSSQIGRGLANKSNLNQEVESTSKVPYPHIFDLLETNHDDCYIHELLKKKLTKHPVFYQNKNGLIIVLPESI